MTFLQSKMSHNINILLHSCEIGDLKVVVSIFEGTEEIDVDAVDENGTSALQVASANNHNEIVQYLLEKGADVNLCNKSGWTPLHHASFYGNNETVKLLLQSKSSVTVKNKFGASPLSVAAAGGHVSTLKILLKEGALSGESESEEFPSCPNPLATAALFGNEAVVSVLLEKEPSWINAPTFATQWTPLMFSANLGFYRVTRALLDSGADVDRTNAANLAALDLAHDNVRSLLQSKSKSVKKSLESDKSASSIGALYFEACKEGDMETIEELFSEHQDVDVNLIEEGTGATGLMLAAIIGHVDLTKMLIGLGANLNAKDLLYGWTALMQATFYGQREVAKLLLKAGADPTIAAFNGCTALDLATLVEETDTSMIRLLAQETVNIAPPFMAFLPISRNASALSRSLSSPAISSKPERKKSGKGLKAWWNKISGRFKTVVAENPAAVSINIIPDEPTWDVQSLMEDNDLYPDHQNHDSIIFTLGFSAATKDLPSYVGLNIEEPELKPTILELDGQDNATSQQYWIDTKKLLGNFNSRLVRKRVTSRSSEGSQALLSGPKVGRSKSRSRYDDFRPRTDSLVERKSSRKVKYKDVAGILRDLDLAKYVDLFKEQEIDVDAFKLLEESDLIEMGIQKASVRKKIMSAVKHWKR